MSRRRCALERTFFYVCKETVRQAEISAADADLDVRFIGAMKIRSAGGKQAVMSGKLLQAGDLPLVMG